MDDRFMESNTELLMSYHALILDIHLGILIGINDSSVSNEFELKAQLNTYISYMRSSDGAAFSGLTDIGNLAKKMVETKSHKFFNLNDLRNKMRDEFLNDSLVCYVEDEIFKSIEDEDILQQFQNMQTRKIKLLS
ncbi:hypothetical protein M9H77_35040 [Catharanthus roseus]|uniref:Uncharacterized protein n=1 Tax=Catharanthus roseus TaxID=4058 RepID=A0ACB9ZNL7_CATRO|nr:hypothetical protein M9H77_35040 [Catharanthus roseus]